MFMRKVTAVVIGLALASASLMAHLVVPSEFRDVVNDASLIVRGRITDVRAVAVPGKGIDSIATVSVENVIKGQASSFVYVRVPGGVIGRTRFVMVGAPAFKTGQRAVLFLRPSPTDTTFLPIGLTMGIYPIQTEATTQRAVILPPVVTLRTTANAVPAVRGDPNRKPMTVPEFESMVRAVMTIPGQAIPRGGR
jgi:hypothetical protein